ncbi:MAG: glycosyltransferase family 32 protein [Lachnospiraceae bacterium]
MIRYIDCSIKDYIERKNVDTIYCFGASPVLDRIENNAKFSDFIKDKNIQIVDSNPQKQGTQIMFLGRSHTINSPEILKKNNGEILITAGLRHYKSIIEKLDGMDLSMECYYASLIFSYGGYSDTSEVECAMESHTTEKIPRIIHSFWFSNEKKPEIYQKCIDSWRKYCPDYKIIEWNCDNYDINQNLFMKQAFECRKWAFVSDVARLDVVYRYGGIYLDMDVELINSIDKMLGFDAFFAMDNCDKIDLGSGFGAVRGNQLVKKMLEEYDGIPFVNENGEMDIEPQPMRLMKYFVQSGVNEAGDSQVIDNMAILSNEYFTSIMDGGDDRFWSGRELAIHWHNAGWLSEEMQTDKQKSREYRNELRKIFKRM